MEKEDTSKQVPWETVLAIFDRLKKNDTVSPEDYLQLCAYVHDLRRLAMVSG
jgi:hypothetical protein